MNRRGFLRGAGALLAAPAIIRTPGLLMPIRPLIMDPDFTTDDLLVKGYERYTVGRYDWRAFYATIPSQWDDVFAVKPDRDVSVKLMV